MNLFLRGKDFLGIDPQIIGSHEPVITSLINHMSNVGYADFLIDIGANIGLTSCQNGNRFREVHMFEPNPHCCKVLEVNAAIALTSTTYKIHSYGLGDENRKCVLTVPINNWGGAFIKDESNSYDERKLAGKDHLQSLIESNYFSIDVEIRKTTSALTAIFQELVAKNLTRGVIKIDVEGYEPTVLKGIAESLPPDVKILLVFESWYSFDMDTIVRFFHGRATPYKLVREVPWGENWPKFLKNLSLLLNHKITNRLLPNENPKWSRDLVLLVD